MNDYVNARRLCLQFAWCSMSAPTVLRMWKDMNDLGVNDSMMLMSDRATFLWHSLRIHAAVVLIETLSPWLSPATSSSSPPSPSLSSLFSRFVSFYVEIGRFAFCYPFADQRAGCKKKSEIRWMFRFFFSVGFNRVAATVLFVRGFCSLLFACTLAQPAQFVCVFAMCLHCSTEYTNVFYMAAQNCVRYRRVCTINSIARARVFFRN